jgi:hypothetical protein
MMSKRIVSAQGDAMCLGGFPRRLGLGDQYMAFGFLFAFA